MLIIAAGSPSTILAVACYCHANQITADSIKSGRDKIIFTQAFQVGPGSVALTAVEGLSEHEQVVLIGLPVNNSGAGPELTKNLLLAVGSRLAGIYDEHEPERWAKIQEDLSLWPPSLFHTPGKGEGHLSAASIIGGAFDVPQLWVQAGDWADNRELVVSEEAKKLASDIDSAVKVRIADNLFRETVIRYLLGDQSSCDSFEQRLVESTVLERNTRAALAAAELDGKVLVVRQAKGIEINQTAAMFSGYQIAPFVAIVGEKSGMGAVVTVGCNTRHPLLGQTDLLKLFQASGLAASGIACKATIGGVANLEAILVLLNTLE